MFHNLEFCRIFVSLLRASSSNASIFLFVVKYIMVRIMLILIGFETESIFYSSMYAPEPYTAVNIAQICVSFLVQYQ